MQLSLDVSNTMRQKLNILSHLSTQTSASAIDYNIYRWLPHVVTLLHSLVTWFQESVFNENQMEAVAPLWPRFKSQIMSPLVFIGPHNQILRGWNRGPTFGWEKHHHHILRRTWVWLILSPPSQKLQFDVLPFCSSQRAIQLKDTIHLAESCVLGNRSHKIHLCGSRPLLISHLDIVLYTFAFSFPVHHSYHSQTKILPKIKIITIIIIKIAKFYWTLSIRQFISIPHKH